MKIDSRLSSIHNLYIAMANGLVSGFTVPAFNLRGMTEELSQGIFEAAKETKTGALILEIARSEMLYTAQPPNEFVRRVLIGADKAGWSGPIFIQGDHSQLKAVAPGKMAEGDILRIKKLIDVEIEAGFFNIDIDASTLVDNSLASVQDQQKINAEVTAELAKYIRSRQPKDIQISIGGEIGHIGDKNSTQEDLEWFNKLFKEKFDQKLEGLSKVSVQTGTSHGGKMNSNGKMEEMKVDFEVIRTLSLRAKELGMGGVVQHGASTLDPSMFGSFPENGAIEIHLSTGWQNMIMDHVDFPLDLKNRMYGWLDQTRAGERVEGETDQQFYYRTRKYAWGEFKNELDATNEVFKQTIKNEMKKRCILLFQTLKVAGTNGVVEKFIRQPEKSESQSTRESENQMRTIEQAEVRGKRVIVRVDWNVTMGKALQIVDDTRIVRTLPTVQWLIDHGAKKIVLMSHLGKAEERRSMAPVVEYANNIFGQKIVLCKSSEECERASGKVVMIENLRLWEGEDENDAEFVRQLANLGDIYVNEAFGESHRGVASIVGIPKYLPSFAGLWLQDEVETILKVRNNPERPLVVVMGGAKVEDKIKLIEVLSQSADTILLGGKLANEFCDKGMKVSGKAKIITPLEGSKILDIGLDTQKLYSNEIAKAKTVIWNGPMGKVEEEQYQSGTRAIYQALCENNTAFTLVGGGDTLASIGKDEQLNRIDNVSTGGGAMLKLMESGKLVGILALQGSPKA